MRLPNGAIVLRDDIGASVDTIEPALRVLQEATASRKLLVMTDISDFGQDRRQRLKYLGRRAGEVADGVVFIGELASYGVRRAIDAGIHADQAHAFRTLREAAEFLRTELRSGDLVLLKGRATDHAARIFLRRLAPSAAGRTRAGSRCCAIFAGSSTSPRKKPRGRGWFPPTVTQPRSLLQMHAVGDEFVRAGDDRREIEQVVTGDRDRRVRYQGR